MSPAAPAIARRRAPLAQAGVGLIELMVVVLIASFMMAGLLSIVYGTRQNFTAQYQIAQLQDNERLAMTQVTNVLQTAGYFYNPATTGSVTGQTPAAAFPTSSAFGSFTTAGQTIYGTGAGTGADGVYARYLVGPTNSTTSSDGTMDCIGGTNPSTTAAQMDVNYLYVKTTTNQLMCQTNDGGTTGTAQPLVNGVTAMTVLYGVAASGSTSAVQYLTGNAVTSAGSWSNVVSAKVTLTFQTTATVAGANIIPMTVTLTRVIDLLNRV